MRGQRIGEGGKAQKKREVGKVHCGVLFLCNVSPCLLPPLQNVPRPMDWGVRCVQLLVKLCLHTKEGEKWEKKEGKASQ